MDLYLILEDAGNPLWEVYYPEQGKTVRALGVLRAVSRELIKHLDDKKEGMVETTLNALRAANIDWMPDSLKASFSRGAGAGDIPVDGAATVYLDVRKRDLHVHCFEECAESKYPAGEEVAIDIPFSLKSFAWGDAPKLFDAFGRLQGNEVKAKCLIDPTGIRYYAYG